MGARKVKRDKTIHNKSAGGLQIYEGTQFSLVVAAPLAANGDDILEASFSLETIYAQEKTVITPIPFGNPYVQTNCGVMPGSETMTGSVTALTNATAVTWARGKYLSSGYPEPAREQLHTLLYPLSGTAVKAYRMDFTYRTAQTGNIYSG